MVVEVVEDIGGGELRATLLRVKVEVEGKEMKLRRCAETESCSKRRMVLQQLLLSSRKLIQSEDNFSDIF